MLKKASLLGLSFLLAFYPTAALAAESGEQQSDEQTDTQVDAITNNGTETDNQESSAKTKESTNELSKDLELDYASFGKDYEINGVKVFGDDFIENKSNHVNSHNVPLSLVSANPGNVQTYSVPSYAVKKSLKWAIKNTTTITNYVGKYLGRDAAVKVGKFMNSHVKPALRKLEKAENLTYGKMETAIREALDGPLGKTPARIAASVIVEAIQILAPI
ncbi:hypothetical protein [Oceanobacillus sp. Castelsardo]|uniref:hypothetical protein n=1 Tax=Oceanobacillus sp. Castelsardo TaxID=1851204 RepID=UPI000838F9FC|nr:hypothetical protein [Oceanobacillus sp. Castelsardo]